MDLKKKLIAGASAVMMMAAPVAAQTPASAPVQDAENGFGASTGTLAAVFMLAVFTAFLVFDDSDQPVSP